MKSVVLFFVLSFVALAVAKPDGSDFFRDTPVRTCPDGEHSVVYCPKRVEPNCDKPNTREMIANPGCAGEPECFCNSPTVRDVTTGKCVEVKDCPKKK